jgi:hypothetical protein
MRDCPEGLYFGRDQKSWLFVVIAMMLFRCDRFTIPSQRPSLYFSLLISTHIIKSAKAKPEKRDHVATKLHQNCPKQCWSSFRNLAKFSALLLLARAVNAEFDAGSANVNTDGFSRHMATNIADTSLEQFDYCNSLEKEQTAECFRDMAAMQMTENSILIGANMALKSENTEVVSEIAELVSENTEVVSENAELVSENAELVSENAELVSEIAELVSENAAMASTIAMLQSSVEIGDTEQHTLLELMDNLDQPHFRYKIHRANLHQSGTLPHILDGPYLISNLP